MSDMNTLAGEVVILHMTNGQPVIGRVVKYNAEDNEVVLYRAMEMMFLPNPRSPDQINVQFTPFLAFGGVLPPVENMPISLADTLLLRSGALVPKTLENGYMQSISGIQIAGANTASALSLVKP